MWCSRWQRTAAAATAASAAAATSCASSCGRSHLAYDVRLLPGAHNVLECCYGRVLQRARGDMPPRRHSIVMHSCMRGYLATYAEQLCRHAGGGRHGSGCRCSCRNVPAATPTMWYIPRVPAVQSAGYCSMLPGRVCSDMRRRNAIDNVQRRVCGSHTADATSVQRLSHIGRDARDDRRCGCDV